MASGAPHPAVRERRRFLIAHNTYSGPSRRHALVDAVSGELEAAGALVERVATRGFAADRDMAASAAASGNFDAIVAAGGDGTLRSLAAGLIGSDVALGLIPLGTGNVMATEIGLPRGPARAIADVLLAGDAMAVRPGLGNGVPFMLMAGAGIDARILARLSLGLKRRIGQAAYAPATLAEIVRRPAEFGVVVDGVEHATTWCIITRVKHYGGSFVVAREQALAGEAFHAVMVRAASRMRLAQVIAAAAAGRLAASRDVTIVACKAARIVGDVAVQMDGEEAGTGPLDIAMAPGPVRLIVPK